MSREVLLLRHPPVAKAWIGRCYGRSDMGLSREGRAMEAALVDRLAAEPIDLVVHSGARRTRGLAEAVAARVGCDTREDGRWLERDFGSWEGRSWDAIWRESGDLMDRIMTEPRTFRPGGGETGAELAERIAAAWSDLDGGGNVLVVAHGGSLAALLGQTYGTPLEEMVRHVPKPGEIVRLAAESK